MVDDDDDGGEFGVHNMVTLSIIRIEWIRCVGMGHSFGFGTCPRERHVSN